MRHELDLFRKWVFGDTSDLNNVGFVLFLLCPTMQDYPTPDFSVFLSRYIDVNYPKLQDKEIVISQRNREAKTEFDKIFKQYQDIDIAYECAMEVLLTGIHFSKYDFIETILIEYFVGGICRKKRVCLIRQCILDLDSVFSNFELVESNERLKSVVYEYMKRIFVAKN